MGRSSKRLGERSEELACQALQASGYRIIERNYKTPRFEVDIIAEEKGGLVFVEVRARRSGFPVHPLETIDHRKVRRILLAAKHYMTERRIHMAVRFDVVSIEWYEARYKLEIIKDAFGWT